MFPPAMLLQVFVLFWTHSAKRDPTGGAPSGEEEMADPGASTLLALSQPKKPKGIMGEVSQSIGREYL